MAAIATSGDLGGIGNDRWAVDQDGSISVMAAADFATAVSNAQSFGGLPMEE